MNANTKGANYRANYLKQTKINYFDDLNSKDLTENKSFWRTVKPFFTDKLKQVINEERQPINQ